MSGAPVYCQAMPVARDGAPPEWVHLLPAGDIRTFDDRGPYRVADAAGLIAASLAAVAGGRLVLDENHATDLAAPKGASAPARGWITELQSRPDGVWGKVDWNESGKALMADRAYRFISPVIAHKPDGTITAVLRASLVNRPNLRGLVALNQEQQMDLLQQLREILGLPNDAAEKSVLDKIRSLSASPQSATPDRSLFVPIADFERAVAEVHRLAQGVSLQAAQDHVERQIREGHMLPFLRDWGVALCSVNKPAFDAFVTRTKGLLVKLLGPSGATAAPPGREPASQLTDEEQALCQQLSLTAKEFVKSRAFLDTAKG